MQKHNTVVKLLVILLAMCMILVGCGKGGKDTTEPTHYTVIFQDYDGTELKRETVAVGDAATAPEEPYREGYIFAGWNMNFSSVYEDKTVTAEYIRITDTVLSVENVTAQAGIDNVYVSVSVINDPGILGMVFSVEYDEQVMTLVDCINGKALPALTFQPPSGYASGCNFVWYGSEAGEAMDGEILKLVFSVADDAPAGTYPITLSWNDHDIYDANCDLLLPEAQAGSVVVTP